MQYQMSLQAEPFIKIKSDILAKSVTNIIMKQRAFNQEITF